VTGQLAAQWWWIAKSFPAESLEGETLKETRALASIAPDLLAVNKSCLDETYEALGFKSGLMAGTNWHQTSAAHVRPSAGEFPRIAAAKGLKEAMRWRDAPFKDVDL
jgi:enoyl-CoA hydratase